MEHRYSYVNPTQKYEKQDVWSKFSTGEKVARKSLYYFMCFGVVASMLGSLFIILVALGSVL